MPPTRIARALRESGIVWIPAHSPQAKGRVEQRLDGTIAAQFQGRYVRVRRCAPPLHDLPSPKTRKAKPPSPAGKAKRPSDWMKNFSIRSGPSLRQAVEVSNARS